MSGSNCPTVIIEKDIIANESVIELVKELIAEISFERQTKSERA